MAPMAIDTSAQGSPVATIAVSAAAVARYQHKEAKTKWQSAATGSMPKINRIIDHIFHTDSYRHHQILSDPWLSICR